MQRCGVITNSTLLANPLPRVSSAGIVWEKVKFCRHMGGDEVPFVWGNSVQFDHECVGGETLILLSDAGLQQQIQLALRQGLNEQFLCPFVVGGTLVLTNRSECLL